MNRTANLSRLRLRALLDPFAKIKDAPQARMYPLREVLLLVCGTIASGDDYDNIVDWGNAQLALPRALPDSPSAFPAPIGCAAS